jgi:hypothetical protein
MRIAAATFHFRSAHTVRTIISLFYQFGFRWGIEARPTAAGIELGFGAE